MPLTGYIFRQKDVSGAKRSLNSVPDPDLDGTRQSDAPLPTGRIVPAVKIVPVAIVLEHERLCRQLGEKKPGVFVLLEIFEMRLPICARIYSAKLHASSVLQHPMIHCRFCFERPTELSCRLKWSLKIAQAMDEVGEIMPQGARI
jgi:hypothetical protein